MKGIILNSSDPIFLYLPYKGPSKQRDNMLVIIKFRCDATSDCFTSPRSFTNLAITLTFILLD